MIKIKIASKKQIMGAVAVVLDEQKRTLILLRPKEARWAPIKWGFPGGKVEPGEEPIDAAIRETKEETQLDIKNLQPLGLKIDKPVHAYYTKDYTGEVHIDYEHDDWTWTGRDEIENYNLAPQVLEMFEWVLENE
jgi:8-oxo-dGTP pyrophosphatase MutT (NUDIX family)